MRYKCIKCHELYEEMDMHEIYYSPEINPQHIPGLCKNCWEREDDLENQKCIPKTKRKKKVI